MGVRVDFLSAAREAASWPPIDSRWATVYVGLTVTTRDAAAVAATEEVEPASFRCSLAATLATTRARIVFAKGLGSDRAALPSGCQRTTGTPFLVRVKDSPRSSHS